MVMPEVTDEMADLVLSVFTGHIAANRNPPDRDRRNRDAMRKGLEELRVLLVGGEFGLYRVSERQYQALSLLAEGMTYEQIAAGMHLSTSTVRTHLHNVYKKLGVEGREQAMAAFSQGGVGIAVSRQRANKLSAA